MLQESILQYFWPSLSYHLLFRSLFDLFLSGRLRQVLLYAVDKIHYTSQRFEHQAPNEKVEKQRLIYVCEDKREYEETGYIIRQASIIIISLF